MSLIPYHLSKTPHWNHSKTTTHGFNIRTNILSYSLVCFSCPSKRIVKVTITTLYLFPQTHFFVPTFAVFPVRESPRSTSFPQLSISISWSHFYFLPVRILVSIFLYFTNRIHSCLEYFTQAYQLVFCFYFFGCRLGVIWYSCRSILHTV